MSSGSATRIAVVGGGTMGADIAAIFLAAGWSVQVVETAVDRWTACRSRIERATRQIGAEARSVPVMVERLENVDWQGIELVIECAPEVLSVKQAIFAKLEQLAGRPAALASNSSSLPISRIAEGLHTRERMLGMHFFMPAHLVPAVEVVRGTDTSAEVAERCASLLKSLGKVPVNVKKDVPGFLANRLQHALAREAFSMIEEGFASAEDIDAAVRFGFGFRYLAAGPVLQKDIAGIDIHCAAAATMYPHLSNATAPSHVLTEKVHAGRLGMKTGEGFYRWTTDSAEKEKARYEQALMDALAILKKDL
jgi:3-hydroxybutyryl-CoA dehydrogenase